jgi:hypothetical protein
MEKDAGQKAKAGNAIPWWLKRFDLVRAELKGMAFPRTAEEGLKQCAELSALSMELFKAEIRKTQRKDGKDGQERQLRRLMNRFSKVEERWKSAWRKDRVTAV